MKQFGGKDSKRHFTVVMGSKEHGLYVSSTPSSAARKAVTKLCAANKSKKVEFHIREITQGSKKKTYGGYVGYVEKLKEPIELKGRVIKYKPVAKLSGKTGAKKGGMRGGNDEYRIDRSIPFKIEIKLEDLSNADKIDMRSLINPFFSNGLIQEKSILINDKDKTIEFKFVDSVDLYEILRQLLLIKNIDEVSILLKSMNIGNYKINVIIPSISNLDETKSFREYMWFELTSTGKKLGNRQYKMDYAEHNN